MKASFGFIVLLIVAGTSGLYAQTAPIFNQKVTDYFTYDPSRTGYSGGSIVFTHQQLSTGFENAPQTNFLGGHTRVLFDQIGLGGSIYYQKAGIVNTYRIAFSGAYHMNLNEQMKLSFGLAPELTRGELDFQELFVLDMDDPLIQNYGNNAQFDVSSGISLHHTFFHAGLVMNRMISLTQGTGSNSPFPGSYSAYLQGKLAVRSNLDLIEPMLFYNRFQDRTSQLDVGGFYTYENLIFLGVMYRTKSQLSGSLGYNVKNRLILGYSYQTPIGDELATINAAHEVSIRINLNKHYFELQGPRREQQTISPELKGN